MRQIVCHLADAEAVGVMRFRQLIAEENPTMLAWDQRGLGREARLRETQNLAGAGNFSGAEIGEFDLLKDLPESAFDRTGTHTTRGPMSLKTVLRMYAEHVETHVKQLQGVRAAYKEHRAKMAQAVQ